MPRPWQSEYEPAAILLSPVTPITIPDLSADIVSQCTEQYLLLMLLISIS